MTAAGQTLAERNHGAVPSDIGPNTDVALQAERHGRCRERLAVFFTRGMSLQGWYESGILERELALYERLANSLGSVMLISYGGPDEARFTGRFMNLQVLINEHRLNANVYSLLAPWLHRHVLKRATVLRTHQMNGAWCGAIAKRLFGVPLVVRCGYLWSVNFARMGIKRWQLPIVERLERVVLRVADRIVVATEEHRRELLQRYQLAPEHVRVIPNFVDTTRFRPEPQHTAKPGTLCFIGRLHEEKNPIVLLEALEGLSGVRLIMVGDGPMREVIEQRVRERQLPVELLGALPHDALPSVLARSQVLILPSKYEGHPKVLLEAMACGVAVIGTDVPGIREVIVHRQTGYLCGTSATEVREAVREVLSDEPLRQTMVMNARRVIESTCSLERVAQLEVELLKEMGSMRPSSPSVRPNRQGCVYRSVTQKLRELNVPEDEASWSEFQRLARLTALKYSERTSYHLGHWWRGPLLYALVRHYRPTCILEIGTGRGYGALSMARAVEDTGFECTIWTIDCVPPDRLQSWAIDDGHGPMVREASLEEVWQTYIPFQLRRRIRLLTGDSASVMGEWVTYDRPRIDFCFIDGGHDYWTAKRDFIAALRVANPGCTVVLDDYTGRRGYGVKTLVDAEIVPRLSGSTVEIIDLLSLDRTSFREEVLHQLALIKGECFAEPPLARFYSSRDAQRFERRATLVARLRQKKEAIRRALGLLTMRSAR